jgi:hypothetical protein
MRVDAAGEIRAELSLDVFRKTALVLGASLIEKRLEVLGDDFVEQRLFGAVLRVAGGSADCGKGHERAMARNVPPAGDRDTPSLRRPETLAVMSSPLAARLAPAGRGTACSCRERAHEKAAEAAFL